MKPQPYPWQQAQWRHLLSYIEQQRIPQALLLSGAAGQGKRHLAEIYARALLCHAPTEDKQACGACHSCKLLDAQTHSDYVLLEPDEPGKTIGIDKIRQLIIKLALKPQFDAQRVVIIQPADALNNASANAFLKCLEEPTERTCLILISEQPARLPPTIRSRCQKINFSQPDSSIARQWLMQQGVKQHEDLLLTLAQGSPLLAKRYAEQNLVELRQDYFNSWLHIAQGKDHVLTVAEQWFKQDLLELPVLLEWLTGWVMDLIRCGHQTNTEQVRNQDFKKPLQVLAKQLELKALYSFYDSLLKSKALLSSQVNKQLLIEQLLIRWSQLNRSSIHTL